MGGSGTPFGFTLPVATSVFVLGGTLFRTPALLVILTHVESHKIMQRQLVVATVNPIISPARELDGCLLISGELCRP